ncbi:MAG: murein L,D-transpeptidase [Desulfobulbus sp.]|jgi:murein L,D-transpeptidase YafK|uniref:L,D-transpeptidase family protein n=1 Tax=Desulfobulbus sp. TaxID=895 RepID=UPI00283E73EC|nr:murein L,D-transpeptidase family protein [Desulfobulbus sp.]MDR2550928.1 murein L,D-transpeptidase [Desulfobulbus sp.]
MAYTPVRSIVGKGLLFCSLLTLAALGGPPPATGIEPPSTPKADQLMSQTKPKIQQELRSKGFALGEPIFVRIFKLPGILELWMDKGRGFELFKSYRVCNYSGFLGPKINEGDWQSPEGFYSVSAEQMNPKSSYHLAFDVGYPNEFDMSKNRTGSLIMVHGDCQSVGCFAMTDGRIEEIYLLAHEALKNGQERFGVHIFPFPLTPLNLKKFAASPWIKFWQALEPGYTAFEQSKQVPEVSVHNGEYVVETPSHKLAMQHTFEQGR